MAISACGWTAVRAAQAPQGPRCPWRCPCAESRPPRRAGQRTAL